MSDQQEKLEALRQAVARIEEEEPAETASSSGESPAAPSGEEDGRSDYDRAKAVVLRKLTGSAKSRHQLAEALREREFGEGTIAEVLDRMQEVHLLDDAEFARTWVRTRHELKNLGRAALRRELKEKGIDEALAEEALEQIGSEDEDAAARELVAKKLQGKTLPVGDGPEERKERDKHTRRLVSMLARRGHSPGAAFQIVREALDEHTAGR